MQISYGTKHCFHLRMHIAGLPESIQSFTVLSWAYIHLTFRCWNRRQKRSMAMPPFVMLTGIANLFGIGGSSLISRSLGTGDREKAKKCAAFSIWSAAAISFLYGIIMYLICPVIFPLLGTDANTYGYCSNYVLWTITIGGIPSSGWLPSPTPFLCLAPELRQQSDIQFSGRFRHIFAGCVA